MFTGANRFDVGLKMKQFACG